VADTCQRHLTEARKPIEEAAKGRRAGGSWWPSPSRWRHPESSGRDDEEREQLDCGASAWSDTEGKLIAGRKKI
jgi:hypothetical protein